MTADVGTTATVFDASKPPNVWCASAPILTLSVARETTSPPSWASVTLALVSMAGSRATLETLTPASPDTVTALAAGAATHAVSARSTVRTPPFSPASVSEAGETVASGTTVVTGSVHSPQ